MKSRGRTLSGGHGNGEGVLAQSRGVLSSEEGWAGSHRAIEGLYFVGRKRQRSRRPRASRWCNFIGRGLEGIQRAIRCCFWGRKRQRQQSPRGIRGCNIMAVGGAGSHRAIRGCNIRVSEGNSRAVRCCNLPGVETQMAEESSRNPFFLQEQRGGESACTPVLY